jgi:hypothetical protein
MDADQQAYLDDPLPFLAEHEQHPPSIDVTQLRDSAGGAGLPEYVVDLLYGGAKDPEAALVIADAIELYHRGNHMPAPLDRHAMETAAWLRYWAGVRESAIGGMH